MPKEKKDNKTIRPLAIFANSEARSKLLESTLRRFVSKTTDREKDSAIASLAPHERRRLISALREYQEANDPGFEHDDDTRTWSESRYEDAMNLARNAAMLNFALLDDDTRRVLILRTAQLRQSFPSVIRDAIELADDTRRAVRAMGMVAGKIDQLQAEEKAGGQ